MLLWDATEAFTSFSSSHFLEKKAAVTYSHRLHTGSSLLGTNICENGNLILDLCMLVTFLFLTTVLGTSLLQRLHQTDNLFQPLISFDLFEHQGERFKRDKMIVMFKGHLFARGTV